MGSVTVTGTRTISTFIRIIAPGRALAAASPVAAVGFTPAGAPAGLPPLVDEGGGTCTLFRGSSWARAHVTNPKATTTDRRIRPASARIQSARRGLHPVTPERSLVSRILM